MFRFACELREPVEPEILQTALDVTMELFPGYRSVLRHGFFWYYLEASDLKPQVRKEASPLCSPIYDRNVSTLLFDVTYFDRRISLEVYHALADGTGALQFLRALVCRYLALRHREELGETPPQPDYDASETEQMADSFQKYYDKKKGKKAPLKFAYKLKGPKLPEYRIKVIEGVMPVPEAVSYTHLGGGQGCGRHAGQPDGVFFSCRGTCAAGVFWRPPAVAGRRLSLLQGAGNSGRRCGQGGGSPAYL